MSSPNNMKKQKTEAMPLHSETVDVVAPTVSETENKLGAKLTESETTMGNNQQEIKGQIIGSQDTSTNGGTL